MSSAADRGDLSESMGGFAFGIGVTVAVIAFIILITVASYYCIRYPPQQEPSIRTTSSVVTGDSAVVEMGVDEETLDSYPKLLYSQAKKVRKGESAASCCSICLAEYKDADLLRILPDCGHWFHLKCVDSWLRMHPTCPICRSSPLTTPLATPLAEVAPLAGRRD